MLEQLKKLLRLANINNKGAVLLGESFAVDGPAQRFVRVVTHIHADHIIGLRDSIRYSAFILATPITHDLLKAMGYRIPPSKELRLETGSKIRIGDEVLVFHEANHIPGAVQVEIEINGYNVGYTSDFKLPGTHIMRGLDVLVIDATYGYEEWSRPWQEEIEELLVDIVIDSLIRGPVHILGYHGKLQEVMILLRQRGLDVPFIAPKRVYDMARTLISYGYNLDPILLEDTHEANEVMKDNWYVFFEHVSRSSRAKCHNCTRILLTGWEFKEPFKKVKENMWIVSFSDHADFRQLVEYVKEARPKLLIADRFRGGKAASYFAEYVRRKLGIPALALPAT